MTTAEMTRVAKTQTFVGKPGICERPDEHYMGIRIQTPFKGMFALIDKHLLRS
jgi:hypothetical protein